MQNAGQFGPGAASTHPPSQFVPSEPSPNGGSTTSSLRQFRKKDVDKSHLEQQSAPKPMSESHVTRIPASHSHHFSPASNDPYSYSGHQFAGAGYSSQVKYSDLNEATQPNPISTPVIQKPKPKEYMEVCNVQPQQQHLNNQQYSPDNGQQQFMFKEHVQGYPAGFKADSHFFAKEQHPYQQLSAAHHPKFNPMMGANMRKFGPTPADNPFLNKLSKLSPSMARSIMSDHHLQETQAGYPAMDQRAMYPQQNHRYYPVSQPNPYSPNHNYPPMNAPHPYSNYSPSCSFARPPQIPPRYPPMERNISPSRRPFSSPEGMHLPPHMNYHHPMHQKLSPVPSNYPAQYRGTPPEYAQHYQHRRMPQDCYPQTCRTPQFMQAHHPISEQEMQELTTEATTVSPSDSLRKFIETWADEEPAPVEMNSMENKLRDDAPAGTVYMINANDVQYFEKNGIPIVTSDNGSFQLTSENYQYLLKNGVVDSGGMVRIIEAPNKEVSETIANASIGQEKELEMQNADVPKPDCMLANKQLLRSSAIVDGVQSGVEEDERRVVIHQNTVLQPPASGDSLATPPDNLSATKELVDKNCSPINLEELNQNLDLNDEAIMDHDSQDSIANGAGNSPGSKSMPIIDFFADGHMVVAAADNDEQEETDEKPDIRSNESFDISAHQADDRTIKSEPALSDDLSHIESEANKAAEDDAEAEAPTERRKRIFSVDDIIHNIGVNVKVESKNDANCPISVVQEFLNKEIEQSSVDQLCAPARITTKDMETQIDVSNSAENPLQLDGTSVIIKLNEALIEINVDTVAGRKVVSVIPLSDSTVVDINDNYKTSAVDCLKMSNKESLEHHDCSPKEIEQNCAIEDGLKGSMHEETILSQEEGQDFNTNGQDAISENPQNEQTISSNLSIESLEIKSEFVPNLSPDNQHSVDVSKDVFTISNECQENSQEPLELSDSSGVTPDETAKSAENPQSVHEKKSEQEEVRSVIRDEQTHEESENLQQSPNEVESDPSATISHQPRDSDLNSEDLLDNNKMELPEGDRPNEPVIDSDANESEYVQINDAVAQRPDSPRLDEGEENIIVPNEVASNNEGASSCEISNTMSPTYVSGTIFEDVLFGEPQEEIEIVPEDATLTEMNQQKITEEEECQFPTLFEEAPPSSDKDSFYDELVNMPLEDEVFIEDPPANEVIVSDPLEGTEASCHSPEIPLEQVSTTLENDNCKNKVTTDTDNESQLSNTAIKPEVQILSPTSTNLEDNGSNACLKVRRHSSTDNDICTSSKVATKAAKKLYEGDLQVQHDIVSSSKKEEFNNGSKKIKKSKRLLYEKSKVKCEPKDTSKLADKKKRREELKASEPSYVALKSAETAQDPDDEYVDFKELLQARKLKKLKRLQEAQQSQKQQSSIEVAAVMQKAPPLKTYSRTFREKKKCLGCKTNNTVTKRTTIGATSSSKIAKSQNDSTTKAPSPTATATTPIKADIKASNISTDDCPTSTSSNSSESKAYSSRDPRKKPKDQEALDVLSETKCGPKKRISLADYVSRKRKATCSSDTETNPQETTEAKIPLIIPRTSSFEWEDSSSPETRKANGNNDDCLIRDFGGLINNNNNNNAISSKPVIDVNELTMVVGERSHEDRKLQEYKEKVDSQLNSLNIHIPIIKSPTKYGGGGFSDGPTFFSRFLKNETLSPSEVRQIKEIISFKKSMQQLRHSQKSPSQDKSPIVSRTNHVSPASCCTSENSPGSAYEVRQDPNEGRLFIKKVQGKRKEPPTNDEEPPSDRAAGSGNAKRNVDYSVFNRLGEDGLPKIIFKRNVRRDAEKEPFVELVKLNLNDLEKVEEKYNVTVSQVM